jgi:hypothetical protein
MRLKKKLPKRLSCLALAMLLTALPAWAIDEPASPGDPGRPERHDWRQLDERLSILERVTINGLLEVEAFHRNGYSAGETAAKQKESDILLATAALDFHAQLTDWISTHVLLLWEEGETEAVEVEEAVISLGDPERFPLFLNAGKMYVPFGVYSSFMIQDPLTLELGETNDTTVQIGFGQAGFYGSVYGFKGGVRKEGGDDTIDNFGANIGYAVENEAWSFDLGLGYLRNMAASDGIAAFLTEDSQIVDYVGGVNAYLRLSYGPFTFYSEYLAALDDFEGAELEFGERGAKPKAWQAELAYAVDLFNRETTFALGYQASEEAVALKLPEKRYLAAVSVALTENLSWAVEYVHDRDYSVDKEGTGGKADMFTTQLAFAF